MARRVIHNKNHVGPQVRRPRFLRGWSQSALATKLQLAGLDVDRSGVSKIAARMVFVDNRTLLYLAEVLNVELAELFPKREVGKRLRDFMEQLETTRF